MTGRARHVTGRQGVQWGSKPTPHYEPPIKRTKDWCLRCRSKREVRYMVNGICRQCRQEEAK